MAIINSLVSIGEGTVINERIIIKRSNLIGHKCVIDSNAYIDLCFSISYNSTILKKEAGNARIIEGAHIDCGRRITDSLIGRRVKILNHENSLPKGHRLILGDQSAITL